jgi:hypothetical protein
MLTLQGASQNIEGNHSRQSYPSPSLFSIFTHSIEKNMTYSCFWDVNEDNANHKLSHNAHASLAFSDPSAYEEKDLDLEEIKDSFNESWIDFNDDEDEEPVRRGSFGSESLLQAMMNVMMKKDAKAKEKETAATAKRRPLIQSKMIAPLEDEGMSTRNYQRVSRRRGV